METKLIGEIGINYAFGDDKQNFVGNAKKLIFIASIAGWGYVKLQTRTPDVCVPESEKGLPKQVPWSSQPTTYLGYKKDVEFSKDAYVELREYAASLGLTLFSSVWDIQAVDFLRDISANKILKIPSALLTNTSLLRYARKNCELLILSTGMSTEDEIEIAVREGEPDVLMHTVSAYPAIVEDLNLQYITWLKQKYGHKCCIGYSGHEFGLTMSIVAAVLGAEWVERHITLDRTLWGSDQLASVEPVGMIKLKKSLDDVQKAFVNFPGPRKVHLSEMEKVKSLRG